jgi:light-regulated signal transduction histidine kinase (bacteriophytochrome)
MEDVEKINSKLIRETGAEITYENLPVMQLNRFSIRQLFQNLIQNAVKYHKPGQKPRIRVTAERPDNTGEWTFAVADNGIGMDQKYEGKIFTIFQRLHSTEEYEGNGVGLAICKKIVEQHKGRIWVKTAIGEGSTFYFTLQELKPGEGFTSTVASSSIAGEVTPESGHKKSGNPEGDEA